MSSEATFVRCWNSETKGPLKQRQDLSILLAKYLRFLLTKETILTPKKNFNRFLEKENGMGKFMGTIKT